MAKAADEDIIAFARGKNAIIVTLDADFHMMLAVSGASGPSVLRLRLQGLVLPSLSKSSKMSLRLSKPI
jgi:predicted nuclease of predicted toxin-antitoxin system